jgi:hypothetical protein
LNDDVEPFADRSVRELLALSRAILRELRRREVIRTGNAPTGDYAELLVKHATGGELAPSTAQRSWDVLTPEPARERLQVKSRMVTGTGRGERQLSPFRSWEFDAAVIVLFDDEYEVSHAAKLPVAELKERARWAKHVNGWLVFATPDVLDSGEDWTERLQQVQL